MPTPILVVLLAGSLLGPGTSAALGTSGPPIVPVAGPSSPPSLSSSVWKFSRTQGAKEGETFAFDKSRLGNTHMWVDPNMPTNGALITEALRDASIDAKIESFHEATYFEEI